MDRLVPHCDDCGRTGLIIRAIAIAGLALGLAAPVRAASLDGQESYDLLFRSGTLDTVERSNALTYSRAVVNRLKPQTEDRDTGMIVLKFPPAEAGIARLEFRQGQKHRGLGVFPASVGNPMIMYFYESVVRDMAESAGGSPFYIRNRVKDALIEPTQSKDGSAQWDGTTIETTTIELAPFAGDPNRERMQGFGDLTLTITMSDAVPGWYLKMVAEVPGAGAPIYRSEVLFEGVEAAQ